MAYNTAYSLNLGQKYNNLRNLRSRMILVKFWKCCCYQNCLLYTKV